MASTEIRWSLLGFFKSKSHTIVPRNFTWLIAEKPSPTRRDLEEVLTAVNEGKPISPTSTKPVGCAIPGVR